MSERRTRLEAASNIIDNARYYVENTESPDLLQQAANAHLGWELFADELAAQLLVAGHEWPAISASLHFDERHHRRAAVEQRADQLRAAEGQ